MEGVLPLVLPLMIVPILLIAVYYLSYVLQWIINIINQAWSN